MATAKKKHTHTQKKTRDPRNGKKEKAKQSSFANEDCIWKTLKIKGKFYKSIL